MRKLYLWLTVILGLGAFTYFMVQFPWHDAESVIAQAQPQYIWLYLLASIVIRCLLGWRWQVIAKAKNIAIPLANAIAYRFASFALNFVTPGRVSGEAVAAGLLRRHQTKKNPISFSKALSTTVLDKSVEFQTFATLFFLGVLLLAITGDIPDSLRVVMLLISGGLLALMMLFAMNVYYGRPFLITMARKFNSNPEFQKHVDEFEQTIVTFYKKDRKEFIVSHLISAVAWIISLFEYKFLLALLGYDAPLYAIFVVYSFVGLAYLIPVPLALGSLEGAQAAAFTILGLGAALGVVLALITRIRDMLFTVIGFMIMVYYGITPTKTQKSVR